MRSVSQAPLTLADFEAARERIANHVIKTPIVAARSHTIPVGGGLDGGIVDAPILDARLTSDVWLKLESTQVSGSFKARGALNRVLSLPRDVAARGIVTASGGNHGLAVAYAGRAIGVPTTVYLPEHTAPAKAARIERWGATVVRAGDVWDDAHAAAMVHAEREGLTYVHPFADRDVVAGQGTLALEIIERIPDVDLLVVAIGGGGLVAGIAAAAKLLRPSIRIIGVEPVGAPTLHDSVRAGELVTLPAIATKAGTLAPRRSDRFVFDIIRAQVESIVLVDDDAMLDATRFLLDELGVGAELSGAAAVAAILQGRIDLTAATRPLALVCGRA